MTTRITTDNITDATVTTTDIASSVPLATDWQAVTVADGSTTLTAEAGKGYFLDTNAGVIEVFFPTSPSRGDTIVLADYAGTFATNRVIINTGTQNLDSTETRQYKLTTNDTTAEFIYVDSAKGWITRILQAAGTTPGTALDSFGGYDTQPDHIQATGGTVTTSGDFKIHTFTGDGTFSVTAAGAGTQCGPSIVDYLVVAGGGGGGNWAGGGGGAGGFRESLASASPTHTPSGHTASPAKATTGITVSVQDYPITVGAGGGAFTNSPGPGSTGAQRGTITAGSNSIFSTITSAGGGAGGVDCGPNAHKTGDTGGSGGGGTRSASPQTGAAGNTPPVSPPQGNPGGLGWQGPVGYFGGGGGGASQAGEDASDNPNDGGYGGDGHATLINPATGVPACSTRYYAGGGAGGNANNTGTSSGGKGGGGNGGQGTTPGTVQSGTANSGGGGGASGSPSNSSSAAGCSGAGGKGIVVIKYKYQ